MSVPTIRFSAPLRPGQTIAVTAPSSGVAAHCHVRLDLVLGHLRAQGFHVIEGRCLRNEVKNASAPAVERADELTALLMRDDVHAVLPPWGGELAIELLPLIDWSRLAPSTPKWLLGYSDLSTLMLPLLLRAGWASAHGPNLMDLAPAQSDPLTTGALRVLATAPGEPVTQHASSRYQREVIDFGLDPHAGLNLTEPTRWSALRGETALTLRGRLIGGCLDTISRLVGTPYGDVPAFVRANPDDGVLLYLENCETRPTELTRLLWNLRLAGWFDGVRALLLGRSNAAPVAPAERSELETLHAVLDDLPCPVLLDLDIGHRPPQFTLVNGAHATVQFDGERGSLTQRWP